MRPFSNWHLFFLCALAVPLPHVAFIVLLCMFCRYYEMARAMWWEMYYTAPIGGGN